MADENQKELPPLGDLEHEVMQLIWARGPATADRVRKLMPRRLKDATIRTVLRRLEEKGYVTHTVDGRTFIYAAVEARKEVAHLRRAGRVGGAGVDEEHAEQVRFSLCSCAGTRACAARRVRRSAHRRRRAHRS